MEATVRGATIQVNGSRRPLRCTFLAELLCEMGHDPHRAGIAVAVNGELVPRAQWAARALAPQDAIEIVGAVQGG